MIRLLSILSEKSNVSLVSGTLLTALPSFSHIEGWLNSSFAIAAGFLGVVILLLTIQQKRLDNEKSRVELEIEVERLRGMREG